MKIIFLWVLDFKFLTRSTTLKFDIYFLVLFIMNLKLEE